ncbi:hypothetical protein SS50377_24411 [Spironucleus salmonicida]|uniref:Uncharacterized protein n=1 Tax=Spironucleus salmonicida TaxID=348837 RepID=V6LYY0_9EUKA|nr:hypothetical protein SS50377_24411 [Spironucleus salmonicida]|eukprot:EST46039.1 Hypothetical protein SS50377_14027 [Spironucleus salmonicida]
MSDIDNFINQIDTFTDQQLCCQICVKLEDQINVYMDVIKEQENQIYSLEQQLQSAEEKAKNELRSEAERRIREKLIVQLKQQLQIELRPQIVAEIRTNYLGALSAEEREALTQDLRKQIYKQSLFEARNELESEVQNRVKEEKEKLRVKLAEVQQLKENLENTSKLKVLETKHKKEIQNIHNLHSREVANLKVNVQNLKKKQQEMTDELNIQREKFFIQKETLEQRIIELQVTSQTAEKMAKDQMSRSIQYENDSVKVIQNLLSSQILDKGHFGFNSQVQQTEKQLSSSIFRTPQHDININKQQQSVSPIREQVQNLEKSYEIVKLEEKKNQIRHIVEDHLENEQLQQEIFENLPPISLPDNKIGNMLESAFQFVFDYWDKIEESYKHRIHWMRQIQEFMQIQRHDQSLKYAQTELLRLRDLEKAQGSVLRLIQSRESQKLNKETKSLNQQIMQQMRSQIVKYKGIDYKMIMEAENALD